MNKSPGFKQFDVTGVTVVLRIRLVLVAGTVINTSHDHFRVNSWIEIVIPLQQVHKLREFHQNKARRF